MISRLDADVLTALLIDGMSMREVRDKFGYAPGRIKNLLKQDDVRELYQDIVEETNEELRSLLGMGVRVLHKAMREYLDEGEFGTAKDALLAADKMFRALGRYHTVLDVTEGAESVAKNLLEAVKNANVSNVPRLPGAGDIIDVDGSVDLLDEEVRH